MELNLKFDFPPLSQNNIERTGARNNIRYKTKEAKVYKQQIALTMNKFVEDIRLFRSNFNQETDALVISYVWHLDAKLLLLNKRNKAGAKRLSSRGGDVFNYEKYTTDCIFDVLGIDDVFIYEGHVKKVPSLEHVGFRACIKTVPLNSIMEYEGFI